MCVQPGYTVSCVYKLHGADMLSRRLLLFRTDLQSTVYDNSSRRHELIAFLEAGLARLTNSQADLGRMPGTKSRIT